MVGRACSLEGGASTEHQMAIGYTLRRTVWHVLSCVASGCRGNVLPASRGQWAIIRIGWESGRVATVGGATCLA